MRKEKPQTTASPVATKRAVDKQPSIPGQKYRADPLFPRVQRAVIAILATKNFVAPVDVLVHAGVLRTNQVEDWRFGRIPYLERVTQGNLSKLSRILRIVDYLGRSMHLKPSMTAYVRWGKGPRIPLRFTKTADPNLEMAYARHWVSPKKTSLQSPGGHKTPGTRKGETSPDSIAVDKVAPKSSEYTLVTNRDGLEPITLPIEAAPATKNVGTP